MKKDKIKKIFKIILIVLIIIFSLYLIKYTSLDLIKRKLISFGKLSSIIYILAFMILPIFFFPVPILVIAAGLIFGLLKGTIYTILGAFFNIIAMYFISKYLGRESFKTFINKRVKKSVRDKLETKNQTILLEIFFVLRLIPLVSYNLINYLAGLTEVNFEKYLITSILGILPGVIVFINIGEKALNIHSIEFLYSIVFMLVLIVISLIIFRIYWKRENDG